LSNKGTQPAFLSIHLCLAHWPYEWRTSAVSEYETLESDEIRYAQALNAVDQQFGQLLFVLRSKGYLDDAIAVLLSDHGEGLSIDQYALKPLEGETGLLFGETYGHGTDVLNPKQYEVVLAYRGFGSQTMKAGIAKQSAGLIDIAPTIADLLDLSIAGGGQYDGISLRPWLNDVHMASIQRYFYVETGFSIPAIITKNPKMSEVFDQGRAHYKVLSDGRVVIKDSSIPLLISQKQYAVYSGDTSFARFPKKNGSGYREVVVDHQKRVYFDPDHSAGEDSQNLRTALYEHFGTMIY
jgi:membrane-anchored protein YejM (alkaline phosphatase superfamily)